MRVALLLKLAHGHEPDFHLSRHVPWPPLSSAVDVLSRVTLLRYKPATSTTRRRRWKSFSTTLFLLPELERESCTETKLSSSTTPSTLPSMQRFDPQGITCQSCSSAQTCGVIALLPPLSPPLLVMLKMCWCVRLDFGMSFLHQGPATIIRRLRRIALLYSNIGLGMRNSWLSRC